MFTSMKIGAKKVPVFVDSVSFTDTHHYARFMGYDKPIEFALPQDGNSSAKDSSQQSSDSIESPKINK